MDERIFAAVARRASRRRQLRALRTAGADPNLFETHHDLAVEQLRQLSGNPGFRVWAISRREHGAADVKHIIVEVDRDVPNPTVRGESAGEDVLRLAGGYRFPGNLAKGERQRNSSRVPNR